VGGLTHPGVAVETAINSASYWTYYTTPELEAAWKKIFLTNDEKALAAQAKELSRIWRESEIKYMLWAYHQPFGISARVKSYKPFQGRCKSPGLNTSSLRTNTNDINK